MTAAGKANKAFAAAEGLDGEKGKKLKINRMPQQIKRLAAEWANSLCFHKRFLFISQAQKVYKHIFPRSSIEIKQVQKKITGFIMTYLKEKGNRIQKGVENMKEYWKRLVLGLLLLLPLAQCAGIQQARAAENPIHGVWISSVLNLDYPSKQGLSADQLRQEADSILETMAQNDLNTAFLQVRPCADALYRSQIFPYSVYLTGRQGGSPGMDPLEYFVEKAHEKGIAVHAWINPYRITKGAPGSIEAGLGQLAEWHPARQNPQWVRLGSDGNLYFDPGLPQVRQLILDGALELAKNYAVDGIHLDDYFYPAGNFDDSAAYGQYGGGKSLEEFRRGSVNELISLLNEKLHKQNPKLLFGVSPAGIWANESSMPEGSKTAGGQSYFDQYADSRAWVKNGWVDYISPQIYWYCGQEGSDFKVLTQWWRQQVKGTQCRLIPGLAAYKAMAEDTASPWYGTQELRTQLAILEENEKSWILFRYGNLAQNQQMLACVKQTKGVPGGKLELARPAEDCASATQAFYFCGTSDASKPLKINDIVVTQRDAAGRWGCLVPLEWGSNHFTIQNGENTLTRTVFRKEQSETAPLETGERWLQQGESAEFFYPAPTGSKVSLWLGGKSYALWKKKPGGYSQTLPPFQGAKDTVTDFSHPLYVSSRRGVLSAEIAPHCVCVIGRAVSLGCTVTQDLCDVYHEPRAGEGCKDFLRKGMNLVVERMENDKVLCRNVGWVAKDAVKLFQDTAVGASKIKPVSAEYREGSARFVFESEKIPAASCSYENGVLSLRFFNAVSDRLPQGEAVAKALAQIEEGDLIYQVTLNDFSPAGWYWQIEGKKLILTVRPKKKCEQGSLKGLKIMLDAGHGGAAAGAYGCEKELPEKQVNLALAKQLKKRLEEQGAQVMMTRESDEEVSLRGRFLKSFQEMPDVFLSLHSNSAADDQDLTNLYGVGLYCRQPVTKELAGQIESAFSQTGRPVMPLTEDSRLYVCRQDFTQAILIENGFLPNPNEFEEITSPERTKVFCEAVVNGLMAYYCAS